MARCIFFLCIVASSITATVLPAVVARPSFQEAEERLLELTRLIGDIKNSIMPRSCNDLLNSGQKKSGVYTVFHKAAGPLGQSVYCDMETEGGGWTVIQKRGQFGNSAYYFYRNWTEYANGFGNPAEEYWIGNHALHALTSAAEEMTLRVVLTNSTEDSVSIDYDGLKVGDEGSLFKINFGEYLGPEGWDALAHNNDQNFSTFDRDNDVGPGNCAKTYRGGWWYRKCHASNLNGLNLKGVHDSYGDGIEWSVRGSANRLYHYSYPEVRMMIRPSCSC